MGGARLRLIDLAMASAKTLRFRVDSLRLRVDSDPTRLVRHARRRVVNIPTGWASAEALATAWTWKYALHPHRHRLTRPDQSTSHPAERPSPAPGRAPSGQPHTPANGNGSSMPGQPTIMNSGSSANHRGSIPRLRLSDSLGHSPDDVPERTTKAVRQEHRQVPGTAPATIEPGRLAALETTAFLEQESAQTLELYEVLAAALVGAPAAYVTLLAAGEPRSSQAAERDTPGHPVEMLTNAGLIREFLEDGDDLLVINNLGAPAPSEHAIQLLDNRVVSYAVVPVRIGTGELVGSLCVVDRQPRNWTDEELALLRDLGGLVSRDIEHRLAAWRFGIAQDVNQRVGHEVQVLLAAVAGLVDRAEQQDDPQLLRYAARARAGSAPVSALVAELGVDADWQPLPGNTARADLGRAVQRAVASLQHSTGTRAIELELPANAAVIDCDAVRLERAFVDLLVAVAAQCAEGESVHVKLAVPIPQRAVLTLDTVGQQVPAAELGTIVARLSAALGEQPENDAGSAALGMVEGTLYARSGSVSAFSSSHRLSFRAEWELRPDSDAGVIDLR